MKAFMIRSPLLLAYVLLALFSIPAMGHEDKPTVYETTEPNSPSDNYGGRSAHMLISGGFGLAATYIVREDRKWEWAAKQGCGVLCQRIGLAFAPGLLKEVGDYYKPSPGTKHGLFSRKDLESDLTGVLLGVGAGYLVEGLVVEKNKGQTKVSLYKEF